MSYLVKLSDEKLKWTLVVEKYLLSLIFQCSVSASSGNYVFKSAGKKVFANSIPAKLGSIKSYIRYALQFPHN